MPAALLNTQPRIRWTPFQLLLMLVPGVIFILKYPGIYRGELLRAQKELLSDPYLNWPPEYCAFIAGIFGGLLMLFAMLFVTALVAINQPTWGRTFKKALCAFGIMTVVNAVVCAGGCSIRSDQTRELETTVRGLHKTRPDRGTAQAPAH